MQKQLFEANEFYLILSIFFSFFITMYLKVDNYHSYLIFISLVILTFSTSYYTYIFFRNPNLRKLVYFIIMILFIIFYFATLFKFFGIHQGTINSISITWHDAIYFSTVTWTTLGYGDYSPISELHYLASVEAIMGQIFMGLLMGKVLYILQSKTYQELH